MDKLCKILGESKKTISDLLNNKDKYFITFPIPKNKGKVRYIDSPQDKLKEVQNKILYRILYKFTAHVIAHGFVKNKSPITNAKMHVKAAIIVKIDVRNFFNSIKKEKIAKHLTYLFNNYNNVIGGTEDENEEAAGIIAELITYRGRLTQGSPTSPVISNLICYGIDKDLLKLAKTYKCRVTRYADDITFSRSKFKDKESELFLTGVIKITYGILKTFDFEPNYKKTRVVKSNRRLKVTGVVVNQRTNIDKKIRRNLRAELHNLKTSNTKIDEKKYQQLRGNIEWIRSLNPLHGEPLLQKLAEIPLLSS